MKTLISQEDPNFARELKLRLVKFESDIEISFTTPYTSVFDFELRSFDLLILDEAVAVEKLRSQLQNIPLKDHPAVIYFFPPSQSEKGFEANRADFACVVTKSPENIAVLPVFIKQAMAQKKKMQRLTILNRQLEEADKAAFLGRIAAGLAHDFNNILYIIDGHAQAAQELDSADVKNATLDIIRDCCDQGKNVAKQLNNLLRPKANQQHNIAIESIINTALQFMQYEFNRRKIVVEKQFQENLRVMCNEDQILQSFLNILANIRDNLSATGGSVTITTHEENGYVFIDFADSGSGIAESLHSKIFDPHFTTKSGNGKSDEFGGSGLGLFISKNTIQRHNGTIDVRNRDEGGTVFTISLPGAPQAPAFVQSEPQQQHRENEGPGAASLDILVVEDEEMIRTVLQNLLTMQGHRVTAVDGAESALHHVKDADYDLILSDLNMPEMSGLEFLKNAKQLKDDVKVVMITGDHYSQDLEEAARAGSVGSLLKPFDKTDLDTLIHEVSIKSK